MHAATRGHECARGGVQYDARQCIQGRCEEQTVHQSKGRSPLGCRISCSATRSRTHDFVTSGYRGSRGSHAAEPTFVPSLLRDATTPTLAALLTAECKKTCPSRRPHTEAEDARLASRNEFKVPSSASAAPSDKCTHFKCTQFRLYAGVFHGIHMIFGWVTPA